MSIYSLYPIKQILVSSIQDYYPILTFNLKIKRKIVTFAGLFAYFGIAHQYGKGIRFDPPSELEFLGGGELWGRVPIGIFITLAILVLLSYLYNYHTFGQYVKAIGGNEKASSLAGVNVDKQRFYTFLLMGIVVGFTAILYIGRMGSYKADYGTTYELFTIAAVTIGGTALYGGKGRVWGAYFGALIFAIVTRAIIYLGIGFRWQQVFTGLLILIGVTMYYAPLGREEEGIPG